jgi:predicted DNA-binding transcriptional regulator AlpA
LEKPAPAPRRLLRLQDVLTRVPISRSTLRRKMLAGQFPQGRRVGGLTMFYEHEIEAWLDALPGTKPSL